MNPRKFNIANNYSFIRLIAISLVIVGLIILFTGNNPFSVFVTILSGMLGDRFSIIETFIIFVPLVLCALSISVADRIGQLSLGAEGQLYMGAIGVIFFLELIDYQNFNSILLFPGMIIFCIFFSGIWGGLAGILLTKFNVNITLSTLLLNFIAVLIVQHLLQFNLKDPLTLNWPQSRPLPLNGQFQSLFNSRFYLGILIVPVLGAATYLFYRYTKFGLISQFIGSNLKMAKIYKLPIYNYVIGFMLLSGAIAGMAGFFLLTGVEGRLRYPISLNYGMTGFMISWISSHEPIRILVVSFLFAGLITGSDNVQLMLNLPFSINYIIQGTVFMVFLILNKKLSHGYI